MWRLLYDGVDAITEVPRDRFDIDALYDARPSIPGRLITRWGGFLENHDQFDASFFGISPREASASDPQHRLLLEVAWESLEDAGLSLDKLAGSRTGVFVGIITDDYWDLQVRDPEGIDIYATTGNHRSVAAGRISWALGLQGPSLAVDTACSSSLAAIHLACQSVRSGESSVALAGGVNLVLQPEASLGFSHARMLAPDGRCKFGDASGNGFVRSDGVGFLVLKPLGRALEDGDRIYAVIRGSAVNNDGNTSLMMTPSPVGQEAVLRAAYQDAGVDPATVQYVEAHGTGTKVGDPVELSALAAVLGPGRPADRRCLVGSVKTNIGHPEGAAGVAGVIKTALALSHRTIPASLHLKVPNPAVPWDELPLAVARETTPWPASATPARAGVSSFGISGTNAHVVLEEAPPTAAEEDEPAETDLLLPLSARSPEALRQLAERWRGFLPSTPESLRDVAFTAGARRSHHEHRLAVAGRSREELAEKLGAYLDGEARAGVDAGSAAAGERPRIVFVFPGQGSQWIGMGRELWEREPVFRQALERCAEAIEREAGWSLREVLLGGGGQALLQEVDVIQPALFAMQVSLAALWRSWGVEPAAVIGQSMGEAAAACVAGGLDLEDAVRVICRRSSLVKQTSRGGAMAVVDLPLEEAQAALAGEEERLSIAVGSSPRSTVLSGEAEAMDRVLAALGARGVFCRLIKVDYASHSPYMDPLRDELIRRLEGLRPRACEVPLFSTVTAGFQDGAGLDPEYWWNNLRQPVLFSAAVERLAAAGHDVFLEVSPHPLLPTPIQQTLRHVGHDGLALASLRREEPERGALLATLGTLWTRGCPVDWARLTGGGRVVSLPSYPWQRERFWHEERRISGHRVSWQRTADGAGHPMLGERLETPLHPGTHVWSLAIGTERFPWLEEHRVQGAVVLPAAAYVEMALAAARQIEPAGLPVLERMAFRKALFLTAGEPRQLQLAVLREISGELSFRFYQHEAAGEGAQERWTLLCEGALRSVAELPAAGEDLAAVRARCGEEWTAEQHYEALSRHGIDDGPSFRAVERLWRGPGESLIEVRAQGAVPSEGGRYRFHPALLDGCFQALLGLLPGTAEGDAATYLPVAFGELRLHRRPDPREPLWSHAALLPESDGGASLLANLRVVDAEGRPVLDVDGFRFQALAGDPATSRSAPDDWFFRTEWRAAPRPSRRADRTAPPGTWIILADDGGAGGRLARELESQGESCVQVRVGEAFRSLEGGGHELDPARPEDFSRLLDELHAAGVSRVTGVLHLWSLDAPGESGLTPEALQEAQTRGCGAALHMVQALVQAVSRAQLTALPRLWLVTREAQAVEPGRPVAVAQAPLWGLGRVLFYEHPELRTVRIDLGPAGALAEKAAAEAEADEARELLAELGVEEVEDEVALRGGGRFVHRLVRRPPVQPSAGQTAAGAGEPAGDRPYRLETLRPGQLENLILRAAERPAPGPGQVEIRVRAAGLNFINVLSAMGIYPGVPEGFKTLGLECAGTVTAVGPGVEEWQPGDEVIALAHDTMATHVRADARLVARRPPEVSAEEAASFAIAFCTAEYALGHLGRLAAGERVLIHAATGGVGLAALQLAQRAGAEIFATAGSEEKRELLRSLGVEHVMDSRSLDFAGEVLRRTGGEGVDVVLNSLTGEAQARGLALLRPHGRFLELGKRDLFENNPMSLQPFQRSLVFASIDLERMIREGSPVLGAILRRLVADLGAGSLRPLPTRVHPASQAAEAFREMAQARHVGKLAVSFDDPEARLAPTGGAAARFLSDGSYLLTGGLGAIGLTVARWMAERGAGHLVLVGRSAPSAEAEAAIAGIEAAGARVTVAQADVARKEEVAALLSGLAGREGQPPLRGVVHAAGLLDDSILLQMDLARWNRVMAPKVLGAWNLHVLTRGLPLDLFVLFSSAAALVGSPGQGNYVASNEFLDALACHRRALGLPGLSIGWGPWGEIGLAASRSDRGARLAERGLGSFTPAQGLDALGRLLAQDAPRFGVMPFDPERWSEFYPAARQLRLFSELRGQGPVAAGQPAAEGGSLASRLRPLAPVERLRLLQGELSGEVARVLRLSAARIDPRQPIKKFGLDSLMAVELKNRIETGFGVSVPIVKFLQGLNLEDLSDLVLEGMEIDDAVEAPPPATGEVQLEVQSEAEQAAHLLARLDQLSDQEVEALLRDLATEEGTQA